MAPLWTPLTHEIECSAAVNSPAVENLRLFNTRHISVSLKPVKTANWRCCHWQSSAQSQRGTNTNYQLKNKKTPMQQRFFMVAPIWSTARLTAARRLIKSFCGGWSVSAAITAIL